ncbi:hypothetical protein Tco_0804371 [Tanacetum coccineum]|uniref:Uncharacterized protein n=1 Tax=Tanacetum coccineum TaxID=301880 RepID=A0ABQ5A8G5_9ASTR
MAAGIVLQRMLSKISKFSYLLPLVTILESNIKGSTASSSSLQNVAFVSENTSSTNEVSTAYRVPNLSGQNSKNATNLMQKNCWLLIKQKWNATIATKHVTLLENVDSRELKITGGGMHGILGKQVGSRTRQKGGFKDIALGLRPQRAYSQVKKVEAQLVAHQQGQLWYEQKIKFMKIDLDDKTDVLTYHKKLLAEAQKEKEDLKAKVEKWHNSSKILYCQNVFMNKRECDSEIENQPLYDRFVTAEGMHVVPPPMIGNYMPSGPDVEIDDSKFTYGPKQTQPSESESQSSEFDTCESNISTEPSELVSELVVNESNVECQL